MTRTISLIVLLSLVLGMNTGCENAGQGAVSGAGIGALSGLAIGSMTGSAGKGAAIGAVVGGVGGAVVGDQNRRKSEAAAAAAMPPPVVVTSSQSEYSTGAALGKLVGNWRINGIVEAGPGEKMTISGSAKGTVENTYFVRLEIHIVDPRTNQPVDGTSTISQRGGRSLEMSNSFSTSPTIKELRGEMDASGSVFTFTQHDPPDSARRCVIRFSTGRSFTAETWDGNKRVEAFTFTPAS